MNRVQQQLTAIAQATGAPHRPDSQAIPELQDGLKELRMLAKVTRNKALIASLDAVLDLAAVEVQDE